jgi:hypothetical protein
MLNSIAGFDELEYEYGCNNVDRQFPILSGSHETDLYRQRRSIPNELERLCNLLRVRNLTVHDPSAKGSPCCFSGENRT